MSYEWLDHTRTCYISYIRDRNNSYFYTTLCEQICYGLSWFLDILSSSAANWKFILHNIHKPNK